LYTCLCRVEVKNNLVRCYRLLGLRYSEQGGPGIWNFLISAGSKNCTVKPDKHWRFPAWELSGFSLRCHYLSVFFMRGSPPCYLLSTSFDQLWVFCPTGFCPVGKWRQFCPNVNFFTEHYKTVCVLRSHICVSSKYRFSDQSYYIVDYGFQVLHRILPWGLH